MLTGAAIGWLASVGLVVNAAGLERGQAAAPGSPNVWDKIYTEAQAKRGATAYADTCAACHGEDLTGAGNAPSLAADDFMFAWGDRTVGELFERIRTLMPSDRPNSLSPEVYRDIVAFILKANKFPAGDAELPADLAPLEQIKITKAAAPAQGESKKVSPPAQQNDKHAGDDQPPGQIAFERVCKVCHGPEARGDGGPRLVPFSREYDELLGIVREGTGQMPPISVRELSDEGVAQVVSYLKTLSK